MRRFVVALVVAWFVATGASDGGQSRSSPAPVSLTGHWRGHVSDSFGQGNMTWDIVQAGTSISGEMRSLGTSGAFRGSVSGTVQGSTLSFTITIVRGLCSITARGTATVVHDTISGTHTGTNSCDGPLTHGELYLSREAPGGDA